MQTPLPPIQISTLIKLSSDFAVHFGITSEISQTGITCLLSAPIDEHDPLLLSFRLNIKTKPVNIKAQPLWQKHLSTGRYLVGFEFIEDNAPLMQSLAELAGSHHSKARPSGQST